MSRRPGTLGMGSNIEARMNAPLDAREVVAEKAYLTASGSFPYFYVGMTVFVTEELKKYTLIGDDPTLIANWKVDEASSGGGDSTLQEGLEAQVAVGGIPVGKTYASGDSLEDILRDMLYPLLYPTLTGPSVSLSASHSVLEKNNPTQVTFTINANRGSISPAYGTSGNRAGEPTRYGAYNDANELMDMVNVDPSTRSFVMTVDEDHNGYKGGVTFATGEQPKDSHGSDYDVAYAGGNVLSDTLFIPTVECVWSNAANIAIMAKETPKLPSQKVFTFVFPAQTVANPECFSIPASWTVSKIEVLNDLSGKYEDCSNEFTVTNTTRQVGVGNYAVDTAYKDYTDNRGYNADTRTIRLTIV